MKYDSDLLESFSGLVNPSAIPANLSITKPFLYVITHKDNTNECKKRSEILPATFMDVSHVHNNWLWCMNFILEVLLMN
jgi:hypothetical protein